jgi:hypothetical protein
MILSTASIGHQEQALAAWADQDVLAKLVNRPPC